MYSCKFCNNAAKQAKSDTNHAKLLATEEDKRTRPIVPHSTPCCCPSVADRSKQFIVLPHTAFRSFEDPMLKPEISPNGAQVIKKVLENLYFGRSSELFELGRILYADEPGKE